MKAFALKLQRNDIMIHFCQMHTSVFSVLQITMGNIL